MLSRHEKTTKQESVPAAAEENIDGSMDIQVKCAWTILIFNISSEKIFLVYEIIVFQIWSKHILRFKGVFNDQLAPLLVMTFNVGADVLNLFEFPWQLL